MRVMEELAAVYALELAPARTAGLLHDAARDLSRDQLIELAERAGIPLDGLAHRQPLYLHGPVGAHLVAVELGVPDRLVLESIATHSFHRDGPLFDHPFCWCVRFADLLAPSHPWVGLHKLGAAVRAGRAAEAALLHCRWLRQYLQERGVPLHPVLEHADRRRLEGQELPDDFFERW
jgi:HD superfamily phosphohydrolase YqeK